jgi:hypothetical protein
MVRLTPYGLLLLAAVVFSSPSPMQPRVADDNIVYVTDTSKFWCVSTIILRANSYTMQILQHDHATVIPCRSLNDLQTKVTPMSSDPHTNIGDSEHPGGMKTYCSPAGKYSSQQGQLPAQFWSNVALKTGNGPGGGRYAQCKIFFKIQGGHEADAKDRVGSDRVYSSRAA